MAKRWVIGILLALWLGGPAIADQHIRPHLTLGVFSYRPDPLAEQRYQPLAGYLSEALGRTVDLRVLSHHDMSLALARNQLDFVMTNPSHFLVLRSERSLTGVLATLIQQWDGVETSSMGGVIVVPSERRDIQVLADLKDRRVALSGPRFLGGYQAQAWELLNHGVDATSELTLVAAGSQDAALEYLLNGRADAAFIRTGLLERLQREGRLQAARFRVINRQNLTGYPFALSTRLYPEWPFVALPHVDQRVVRQVASALLALDGTKPVARHMEIAGFSPPADYQSVERLARDLRLPPYDQIPTLTWPEFWQQYRYWATAVGLLILLLVVAAGWLWLQRQAMIRQQKLAATVFDHSREGVFIAGANQRLIDVNDAFTDITGFSRADVVGRRLRFRNNGDEKGILSQAREQGYWSGESWRRRKNGEAYACVLTISSVHDGHGHITHYVGVFSDVTALKEQEQRLRRLAHYDPLTGLPNRVLLADRLHQAMALASRQGSRLALAYIDLDGFKAVNDAYGHRAGDELLMDLARRMRSELREQDTLARLGGDEFVALIVDAPDHGMVEPLLDRLLAAAAEVVLVGDSHLQVSASIGVAYYPQVDELDADQLVRQADQAMYLAKQTGRNRYYVFDHERERDVRTHHEQLEQVREALGREEFVLFYQPKVDLVTGQLIGVEALIRWQHPEQGLLPPAAFLPAMAGDPLLLSLGEWVREEAIRQHMAWRDQGLRIPVSVNVDSQELMEEAFLGRLESLLARYPELEPDALTLEILETSALKNLASIAQIIRHCQSLGVVFSVDDFGTGYSSLNYLKQLPARELKIDRSFVRGMREDTDNLAILEGIIALSRAFSRTVIAEGVETEEHGTMLIRLGCRLGQGYFIARPMAATDLPAWLDQWRAPEAWLASSDHLPSPANDGQMSQWKY